MERREEILERLANHPLTREFASWLYSVEEDADEMLCLSITELSDEEPLFDENWQALIQSFLMRLGEFSLERVYGSACNLVFIIVPKILFDGDTDETLLQLFILELKTRTVAAVAEHDGTYFRADDVESLLKQILDQLRESRSLFAVRMMVE